MANERNHASDISKTIKNANEVRELHGMRKLVAKKRECLRCDKKFLSQGPSNRMCRPCGILCKGR